MVIIDVQHGLFPEAQRSNAYWRGKREQFRLVGTDLGYSFPSYSRSSPVFKRLNERVHVNLITNRIHSACGMLLVICGYVQFLYFRSIHNASVTYLLC
jgi:hypothetical protein